MGASATTDEDLMLRFASGNVAAFDELYARHELPLWRYLLRRLGDRAIAEELLQEVWFALARSADRYRAGAPFAPWLYTMARNRLIDHLRTRRLSVSLDAVVGEDGASRQDSLSAPETQSPDRQAERAETGAQILRAVAQLPDEQREAFLLQAEAGLTVEQIAAVTGTGFETAKSRLRYARQRLQQLLQEYA